MSSSDNESQAGPSTSPPPKINEAEGKQNQGQGRRRKAGGVGKKGKIFLEDKVSRNLLCPVSHRSSPKSTQLKLALEVCIWKSHADVTGGAIVTDGKRNWR